MVCPFCLHTKTKVYNSRQTTKLGAVWRRRQCAHCNAAFTTTERVALANVVHVMRGGKKEVFSKAKLLTSLLKECGHRDDYGDAVLLLHEAIEQKLFPIAMENDGFVTPAQIINTVLTTIKQFDPTFYIKYLTSHKGLLNAQELKQHLK